MRGTPVTREAMILAGGLGTRLRAAVSDRPKPMAEVAGRPFIAFLLDHLLRYGFKRAVLCVGHMGECVPPVLGDKYGSLDARLFLRAEPRWVPGARCRMPPSSFARTTCSP